MIGDLLFQVEKFRLKWSLETFPKSTALTSLKHAENEIAEIRESIEAGKPDIVEYVDAVALLFDSLQRAGFNMTDFAEAYANKFEENMKKEWRRNGDAGYKHIDWSNMSYEEYIEKRKELSDALKKQLRSFDVAYSKSIQKYQVGDIVGNETDKILIEEIRHGGPFWKREAPVEPYYTGVILTGKGTPRTDGRRSMIAQANVIYHKPKE